MEALIWKLLNLAGLAVLGCTMGYLFAVALTTVN